MKAEPDEDTCIVAGTKPWSRRVFDEVIRRFPGRWILVARREQLTPDFVRSICPRYVFFLHWCWVVPEEIIHDYECVCFHMTDVPYGQGGSPLQNLILRGHSQTKLTALRMARELDAGPVYSREDLSLEGSAEEIYTRATELSARMIKHIILEQPDPKPQEGEVVVFERRKPSQSKIPGVDSTRSLYDFIRMLDAETYPRAFLVHNGFRYQFSGAKMCGGSVSAEVMITPVEDAEE